MNIALVGTGRMGTAVEALAPSQGHTIVARFNRAHPLVSSDQLAGADVAIDFTLHDVVVEHLHICCRTRIPVIVGTTGWYAYLPEVQEAVARHRAAVLHSPNFSLGVQIMQHAVQAMALLLEKMPDYDVAIHETHHAGKVDRPSGTAIQLAETLVNCLQRKTAWGLSGHSSPHKIEVSSTRLGTVFGRHAVTVDSPQDQLSIVHRAKNRDGFAVGALKAAAWIRGRQGLFTLQDMLSDWLSDTAKHSSN